LIIVQWFQTTHARRYHKHYGTSGHLGQGRYKNFAIKDDEQLFPVIRYVEANLVRAKMIESATDWPWSSHRDAGTGSEEAVLAFSIEGDCPSASSNRMLAHCLSAYRNRGRNTLIRQ
jgi:hypothetical protein